jgi:peptide/nickel transport system ATP-binding protein
MSGPLVEVSGLKVGLEGGRFDIVDEVSFEIAAGEILGLVGESGSGKTTVALALLGHCRRGARIAGGAVRIGGTDLIGADAGALRAARGRLVAYIPQDPATALNPALRVGEQLEEVLDAHARELGIEARRERIDATLREVLLPADAALLRRYPHQFSGGQQQRIALAMAFAARPRLIVLDEPTTGLDVSTQAHVLETVRTLCREHGVAALYVSHDLAVVAELAHRVAVMYAGRVVETGPADALFRAPAHPYTQRLLLAVPDPAGKRRMLGIAGSAPSPVRRPAGCFFAPRCELAKEPCRARFPEETELTPSHLVRCFHAGMMVARSAEPQRAAPAPSETLATPLLSLSAVEASYGSVSVLRGIDLDVSPHECVALVGESGSGKTTLARCIAGLHSASRGELRFRGETLRPAAQRSKERRQAIQYVFQNPYASLNPRRTIGEIVARPLRLFFDLAPNEIRERVAAHLERVSLSPAMANCYPDQLSGGERQRVAVARALAAEPELLICDEITSALDVSVQAAVVELLIGLRSSTGLGMLFVTHNLPLIRTIADRVAVMSKGRIVELGATRAVFEAPQAEYTRELLANTAAFDFADR